MSSGLGSHQTPVAAWDLVMGSKSGPALIGIGPTLSEEGVQSSAQLIHEIDEDSLASEMCWNIETRRARLYDQEAF